VRVEEGEEDAGREMYIPVSMKTDGKIVRAEDVGFEQRLSLRLCTAFTESFVHTRLPAVLHE
jgi:hypothetical protein